MGFSLNFDLWPSWEFEGSFKLNKGVRSNIFTMATLGSDITGSCTDVAVNIT